MVEIILAAVSGILTGLSFDAGFFHLLPWISLVPLFYALSKSGKKKSLLLGFLFGSAYYFTAVFWVGEITKIGLTALVIYFSLYYSLLSLFFRLFLRKPLAVIILPCLWVILEFLKESLFVQFGWLNLGYSQYKNTYLIQIADLGGGKLVSFIIVMVNVLFYKAVSKKAFIVKNAAIVTAVLLGCIFYSFFKLGSLSPSGYVKVSLIQPNTPENLKWEDEARPYVIKELRDLSKLSDNNSLLVFPEAAWPAVVDTSNIKDLKDFTKSIERDSLIGAVTEERGGYYNTALLFDKKADILGLYHKIKLVPFGEYIPFRRYLRFIKVINSVGDMSEGSEYKIFNYGDKRFAVLICFEDLFPDFVFRFARSCDFIINITNDGWFKGNPEAEQHLAVMALRAVENRISIVRCANTGISGWVSFKGKIYKMRSKNKDTFFKGVKTFKVSLNKNRSFYAQYGDKPLLIFCLIGVFLGLIVKGSDKN